MPVQPCFLPSAVFPTGFKRSVILTVMLGVSPLLAAQETSSPEAEAPKETFTIGFEFRPRTEYRNGYRQLRGDSTQAALFTEQRARLSTGYERKGFLAHISMQDVRIWGEQDPRSTAGSVQVFEAYVETLLAGDLSLRLGRQSIKFDNQRLFAENNWRQNGGAHEAVNFIYSGNKIQSNLIGAFNQPAGAQNRFFGTYYDPGFNNYKALIVNFFEYKINGHWAMNLLNVADVFQDEVNRRNTYWRFTNGGRLTFEKSLIYLTLASYYQYGNTPDGSPLSAFYFQPEIKLTLPETWSFCLGAEIFSGDNGAKPDRVSRSFDALYGVNHRFLGVMDYFTRYPADTRGAGIVAPYLVIALELSDQLAFRSDNHLFYSQNNFIAPQTSDIIEKFLGFEHDLLLRFRFNPTTELNLGYSYALVTRAMEHIKNNSLPSSTFQDWAFLMISFKPELFRHVSTVKP